MKTILDALGIEIVEVSSEKVVATMPVHDATRQPFGQLHGGDSKEDLLIKYDYPDINPFIFQLDLSKKEY